MPGRVTRLRTQLVAVAGAGLLVTVTACGSQVPPTVYIGNPHYAFGQASGTSAPTGVAASVGASSVATSAPASGSALPTGPASGRPSGVVTTTGTAGGGSQGGGGANAAAGVTAGSCAGFKTGTGISSSTITVANIADISGPVPGLFKSAQAAVTAYVAYFNATSNICGRKLKLVNLDSGTSAGGDQQATQTACDNAFATIGSLATFDSGGVSTGEGCGLPEIPAITTEPARQAASNSFATYGTSPTSYPAAVPNFFKGLAPDIAANAAMIYINAGAGVTVSKQIMNAFGKDGFTFKDVIVYDATSVPNWNGYVSQLQSHGDKFVMYTGDAPDAAKLKSAMYQAAYNPVFVPSVTSYDPSFVGTGDQTKAVDGTYVYMANPLVSEAASNPELATYETWLSRTAGGTATYFGIYSWAAAKLFTQLAIQLGGQLTRPSLLTALRNTHAFTANGLVPPQDVGGKQFSPCITVAQLQNGQWVRRSPAPYLCQGLIQL